MRELTPFERAAVAANTPTGAIQFESGRVDDPAALIDPEWRGPNPEPDPDKDELLVPGFDDHPMPEVARFLWVMARRATVAPPWRVRVHPAVCAGYTMRRISVALAPHASIVMDPSGRFPAPMLNPRLALEWNYQDNGAQATPGKRLWLPGEMDRTRESKSIVRAATVRRRWVS